MSAYKKLNKQDVYVSSYTARKSWEASGSLLDTYGVKNLRGVSTNIIADSSGSNVYHPHPNDLDDGFYRQLVYQQIKHLYDSSWPEIENFCYGLLKNRIINISSSHR